MRLGKIDDEVTLGPGGAPALGKFVSHLPRPILDAITSRVFER